MSEQKGTVIVLSGFSGAGKGTIMKHLLNNYPSDYHLSVSATTRERREGEEEGREYFFRTTEEFENMIANDEFLEHAGYVNNMYGTPKRYVLDKLNAGENVILEIEMQGGLQIKEKYPDAVLIFMAPPSAYTLKKRLVDRNTEEQDVINKRLARAAEEIDYIDKYDYLVINDELETCINDIQRIVTSEKNKVNNQPAMVDFIKKDFKNII